MTVLSATLEGLAIGRSSNRWLALTILALAQFLVVLDASIVNIALPSLEAGLGLDHNLLTWVITAYVLPFGGLLLLGGRLADRYGHRNVFLAGVFGFIAASLAAGFSINGAMLLAARAVQGASAAMLAPAALALLMQLFPAADGRAKALGLWGAVAGMGSAAGVLLGGVLTAGFGWAAIFFINVPVGLVVLVTIPALVSRDAVKGRARLDLPGAATVTAGIVALVAAFSMVLEAGFGSPITLGLAAVGIVLLALFVLIEMKTSDPLVFFAIFANRSVTLGNTIMLLIGGVTVGLFFVLSLHMQNVLGYDAMKAGISQLPLAIALIVTAGMLSPAIARAGSAKVLAASLVVLAAGVGWLALAPIGADFLVHLLGPSLVIGIGLGGAFIAGTELAVQGVGEADSGLASGLVNTSQQIGGALGLALIFTLATARTIGLGEAGADDIAALGGGYSAAYLGAAGLALLGALIAGLGGRRA
ncbi:DHA2 family efflux MFS transporter permease subunit [Devosia nitrariae]|uniref:MFS transporter n=1 Tax=Devosia nitrariae TaxID=2071872 RepID=A0ABQ5W7P3_9HYPH|nr:DHA2 family efflux MFS transporter permease subunit [Devosia nitrariae]GLQ55965.1 MFS transporter [Devosia nitrariae]